MDAVKRVPMLRADDRLDSSSDDLREPERGHGPEDSEHLRRQLESLSNQLDIARETSWAALTALHDSIIDSQADARERVEMLEKARTETAGLRDALSRAEEGLRRGNHDLQELRISETAVRGDIVSLSEQLAITGDLAQAVLTTLKEKCSEAELGGTGRPIRGRWARIGLGPLGKALARRTLRTADRARDAKEWQTAARHYRDALRRSPDLYPIWIQYGHALKESGRLAEAEAAYRRGLMGDPENADSYLQLGHVLKLLGRIYEARRAYLYAAAIDPNLSDVTKELQQLGWSSAHVIKLRELAGAS